MRRFGTSLGSVSRYANLNDIVGNMTKRLSPPQFPDQILPFHAGECLFDIDRADSYNLSHGLLSDFRKDNP